MSAKVKIPVVKNKETLPPNGITFDNIVFCDGIVPIGESLIPCQIGTLPVTEEGFFVTGFDRLNDCYGLMTPDEKEGKILSRRVKFVSRGIHTTNRKLVFTSALVASFLRLKNKKIDTDAALQIGESSARALESGSRNWSPVWGEWNQNLLAFHVHILCRIYWGTKFDSVKGTLDFSRGSFL